MEPWPNVEKLEQPTGEIKVKRTPSGEKDYSKGENTFRPTKKISKDTPKTWSQLSAGEKRAAAREKNRKGRVSRYKKGGKFYKQHD